MKKDLLAQANRHIFFLDKWLEKNGYSGWDPYDIWDNKFGVWARKRQSFVQKCSAVISARIAHRYPNFIRKLFRTKRTINPKAMGLLGYSFAMLANINKHDDYLRIKYSEQSQDCLDWLINSAVNDYGGTGWGYPFDWQSRILIPRNTPTIVNSAIIGDAFWVDYKLNGNQRSLDICKQICDFFVLGVNHFGSEEEGICLSYTPVDNFQVHNANLLAANFLIRIGTHSKRHDYLKLGKACVKFSVNELMTDGTLAYWSKDQCGKAIQQDIYHSGFEIRSLLEVAISTADSELKSKVQKFYDVWKVRYIPENIPLVFAGKQIIEVHGSAEAILTMCEAYRHGLHQNIDEINDCLTSITKYLWKQSHIDAGYFMYKNDLEISRTYDIPYIRWGEAWMLRALVEAYIVAKGADEQL